MKKAFVLGFGLLLILALIVPRSSAIEITTKGFKIGPAVTNLTGSDIDGNKSKLGYAFGGFLKLKISEGFSLRPELLVVQKGTKWQEGDTKVAFRMTYLEIPVLAEYAFAAGPGTTVSLFAGPAIAIKAGSKIYYDIDGDTGTEDLNDIAGLDLGLAFGAGIGFPFGGAVLSFDVRYTLGLMNCFDYDGGDSPNVKNGAILFLVGIGL